MSKSMKEMFCKKLLQNPDGVPVAAISKSEIGVEMAILLIWQSESVCECASGVLNLSSWYASPHKRGVESVFFAKWFTQELNQYILTNKFLTQLLFVLNRK